MRTAGFYDIDGIYDVYDVYDVWAQRIANHFQVLLVGPHGGKPFLGDWHVGGAF